MWDFTIETLEGGRRVKYWTNGQSRPTFGKVIELWQRDETFRSFFADTLRDAPFDAYRWETPPVTKGTLDREFEFVLIDCPPLARKADRQAFGEFFQKAKPSEQAIAFENLGRDATLVVPCPADDSAKANLDHYAHLASFIRQAEESQVDAFWELVGQTMSENVSDKPIWLSTAGMGVAWLHVRLDQRPKYYAHGPYREDSA